MSILAAAQSAGVLHFEIYLKGEPVSTGPNTTEPTPSTDASSLAVPLIDASGPVCDMPPFSQVTEHQSFEGRLSSVTGVPRRSVVPHHELTIRLLSRRHTVARIFTTLPTCVDRPNAYKAVFCREEV